MSKLERTPTHTHVSKVVANFIHTFAAHPLFYIDLVVCIAHIHQIKYSVLLHTHAHTDMLLYRKCQQQNCYYFHRENNQIDLIAFEQDVSKLYQRHHKTTHSSATHFWSDWAKAEENGSNSTRAMNKREISVIVSKAN